MENIDTEFAGLFAQFREAATAVATQSCVDRLQHHGWTREDGLQRESLICRALARECKDAAEEACGLLVASANAGDDYRDAVTAFCRPFFDAGEKAADECNNQRRAEWN